jgi:hypothetical protein
MLRDYLFILFYVAIILIMSNIGQDQPYPEGQQKTKETKAKNS